MFNNVLGALQVLQKPHRPEQAKWNVRELVSTIGRYSREVTGQYSCVEMVL